jgi:hypothetical protein
MFRLTKWRILGGAALSALGVAAWSQAQPPYSQPYPYTQQQGAQSEDPADAAEHGVARISLVQGNVSVVRGDSSDAVAAGVNAPLVTGDRVVTTGNSRAEVQFDPANLVRVAPDSDVRMSDLQYRRYQVQVGQGTVTFRVLRDNSAQVEISTPSMSVQPRRPGTYRVTVRPDGTSEVTVRSGEAQLFSPSGSEPLYAGQTIESRGSPDDPEFRTSAAIPYDDWDRFNADRDRVFESYSVPNAPPGAGSPAYASPDIYGMEDLGPYGRWVYDPAYGWVWVPTVPADWAPYQIGRWSWLDYYGWTWVSYDPWGWAPYHWGRWYHGGFGWAWYPGPIVPRCYWRPALVGFFGWGSPGFGASFSFGFGNIGWVPLAPFEPYHPWYGRGFYGGRGMVIVNNTNIVNVYHNARFGGAVTGLRASDFGRVGVGRNNFVRPGAGDLAHAGMVNGAVPFRPSHESRFISERGGAAGVPRVTNAQFFSSRGFGNRFSVDRAGGSGFNAPSQGGWRRIDPGSGRAQQPVQIRPPIVTNRGGREQGGGGFWAPQNGYRGNAGGAFGNSGGFSGGNADGGRREPRFGAPPAPRAPYGGGYSAPRDYRSAPPAYQAPPSGSYGGGQPRGGYGGGFGSPRQGAGEYRGGPPAYRQQAPSGGFGGGPRGGFGGGNGGYHGGGGGGGNHGGGGHSGGRR